MKKSTKEAATMTAEHEIQQLIQELRTEIRHKALMAGLSFDDDDIDYVEDSGYYVVALKKIKVKREVIEDGVPVTRVEKEPIIWAEYPPPSLASYDTTTPGEYRISIPLPQVHCRFPWLVYIISPDGTYKTDSNADNWLSEQYRKATEAAIQHYL
jgi:hypothetical protein